MAIKAIHSNYLIINESEQVHPNHLIINESERVHPQESVIIQINTSRSNQPVFKCARIVAILVMLGGVFAGLYYSNNMQFLTWPVSAGLFLAAASFCCIHPPYSNVKFLKIIASLTIGVLGTLCLAEIRDPSQKISSKEIAVLAIAVLSGLGIVWNKEVVNQCCTGVATYATDDSADFQSCLDDIRGIPAT